MASMDRIQAVIEEARKDPFEIQLNNEFFPLRDRVRTFNRNTSAHLKLADFSEEDLQLWIDFSVNEHSAGELPLRATSTDSTLNSENQKGPDRFKFSVGIYTGHLSENQSTEMAEKLNSIFRIKIADHSTGQIFIATISTDWDTGFDGDIIGFRLEEFMEIDNQGNLVVKHFPLTFPNTPEVTQNLGITFESVPTPVESEPPLHQQT